MGVLRHYPVGPRRGEGRSGAEACCYRFGGNVFPGSTVKKKLKQMPSSEMERIICFTGLAMEWLAGGERFEDNTYALARRNGSEAV